MSRSSVPPGSPGQVARGGASRHDTVLEEELLAALGADDHVRTPMRRGDRHGTTERTLTTREGTRPITGPRARLRAPDGTVQAFQSTVVPR
ncbi:MAG: transposase [Acidobacteriota bacterium]|nr:transposase [Acidobacteriota bacterium]